MKFLDEQIVEQMTGSIAGQPTGIYEYRVLRKVDSSNTYTTIFVGSLFHEYGKAFRVDITDIVRNDGWVASAPDVYSLPVDTAQRIFLVNTYKVDFYIGETSYRTDGVQVAKVYRYPHKIRNVEVNPFFDYTQSSLLRIPAQGSFNIGGIITYRLIPHYPYISTSNYRLPIVTENSSNVTSSTIKFSGRLMGGTAISFLHPSSIYPVSLSTLYNSSILDKITGFVDNFYRGHDDFTAGIGSTGATIIAQSQSDLYCMLVEVNSAETIVTRYTEWLGEDDYEEYTLTLSNNFYTANDNGRIRILLSYRDSVTPQSAYDYDCLVYKFNIPSSARTAAIGRTVKYEFGFSLRSWMYSWLFYNFPLYIIPATDQAFIDIASNRIATIDFCPSRFYLQWQDRYGGFQSQPFNKFFTFSENFEKETVRTYTGEKRVSNITVTPKFKINSDWLREDLYPYYESIFTSPVLYLYDTEEDKCYSVMVTDSEYTEKTFDNQKKLFNITLNLELTKQQNIIY